MQTAPQSDYHWLAARARLTPSPNFRAFEVVRNGVVPRRITAMAGFDGETANALWLSVAADEPIALRHLIKPVFGFAFRELGKEVILASVLSTNQRSLKIVEAFGFREVYRGKEWVDHGVDLIVFEMRRRDCKWLEEV